MDITLFHSRLVFLGAEGDYREPCFVPPLNGASLFLFDNRVCASFSVVLVRQWHIICYFKDT